MTVPGLLPDPEVRLVRRERAARRWAGTTAVAAVAVGGVAWLAGPCLYLLVRPYVWHGAGWLAAWSAVFGLVAVALIARGGAVWRACRRAPTDVPSTLARLTMLAGVLAVPALLWATYAGLHVLAGGRPRFRGNGLDAAAIVVAPVLPLALGLWTLARFRRLFHGMPAMAAGAPAPRARISVRWGFLAAPLLAAWLWPGGPRVTATSPVFEGGSLDDWARRYVAGEYGLGTSLSMAGPAAIPAVAAQWPLDTWGLRPLAADWLQSRLRTASSLAPPFAAVRAGGTDVLDVLRLLASIDAAQPEVTAHFTRWGLDGDDGMVGVIVDVLAGMGREGARALAALSAHRSAAARQHCAQMLAVYREPGHAPLSDADLAPVVALLEDPGREIRCAAARAYAAWCRPERVDAIAPALRLLMADPWTRPEAIDIAGAQPAACRALAPELLRLGEAALDGGDHPRLFSILTACARCGVSDPGLATLIDRALASEEHAQHRAGLAAVHALGAAGAAWSTAVRHHVGDADHRCRAAAVGALVAINGADDEALALIEAEWQAGVLPRTPGTWKGYSEMLDWLAACAPRAAAALPLLDRHLAAAPIHLRSEVEDAIDAIRTGSGTDPGPK